jgi:nitrogen fixation/metabolism regulation signal transduction histidine kinase
VNEKLGVKWQNKWHTRLKTLTPMRLTVQSFQRRFSPEDPQVQKMKDYSETLIQQIDTMSAVASAFSNFIHACPTK